ncbi:MAG: hemerythrin domain-containing protein [Anaerolineae bacterium]|nr:hemerythrin domain-containing protein [Anaerolineae bacterium]
MSDAVLPKPEIGGDLVRVHRAITRAVGVALEHGEAYAATGFPDADTRKGYLTFVRCLVAFLHGHHTTEDEAMFPSLRSQVPGAPYETLMAQHGAMMPVLHEIEAELAGAASSKPDQALGALWRALVRIDELWRAHMALEESHFGPGAIGAFLSMEERERVGRAISSQAAKHQRPFALMLPFFLYNMSPEDRAVMSQAMPGIAIFLFVKLIQKWTVMAPFLLVDA